MVGPGKLGRTEILDLVLATVREALSEMNDPPAAPESVEESTCLIGWDAILDSLALVTAVLEVEQSLAEAHNIQLTLADDRAMSQKHSPFRTVGSLTDYIYQLVGESD